MKSRIPTLYIFVFLIFILLSLSCSFLKPKSDSDQAPSDKPSSDTIGSDLLKGTGDEIKFGYLTDYQDVFGTWNIHGVITNIADYSVGGIELELTVLDENGSATYTQSVFTTPTALAPGETLPYDFRLPPEVITLDLYEINILQMFRVEKEPVQMEITDSRLFISNDGVVTLVGEVQNSSSLPAELDSITAALFSADGNLITTETCQVCTRYLDPGDTGPIQFLIYGHPEEMIVDRYDIYISAEETDPIEAFDVTFSDQNHNYIDLMGNFHVLGDVQNNGDEILDIQLLTSFYDSNQQIVGASTYALPMNSVNPGESSPFEITMVGNTNAVDWSIQVDRASTRVVESPSHNLSLVEEEHNIAEYLSTFSGKVVNDTNESLEIILVVVGLREINTGNLIALSSSILTDDYPTGSNIEYNISISSDPQIDLEMVEYFILARGR